MTINGDRPRIDLDIRAWEPGDAPALRAVFASAVHELACRDYTTEQCDAWAPREYDADAWARRLESNRPFVAVVAGTTAGFADVQEDGYIDMFFVAAPFAGQGIGSALMRRIHDEAPVRKIGRLWSNVSLTAERFFARQGFAVEAREVVTVRGVEFCRARMSKWLESGYRVGV